MSVPTARSAFVRMFGSAVIDQGLLSAASLLVGLLLIRQTANEQYGYYVLVANAFLLLTSLQNGFIGPAMVIRMTGMAREQRGDLFGGLYRDQRTLILALVGGLVPVVLSLWYFGMLNGVTAPLVLVALAAAPLSLNRDFFRLVLLAHQQSERVLWADMVYAVLLVLGVIVAARTASAAPVAVAAFGLAALVGGLLLYRSLRAHCPWNPAGSPGILASIVPLGAWSVAGAAIHWTFSQGYSYVVAGVLDVSAVGALAATRLLMMPVNLLSTGINSLMLPLTSNWLQELGVGAVIRRLALFAAGIGLAALGYFGLMWLLRDWIFSVVLRKDFADRDRLLLMWSAIFLLMVMRDQLIPLLIARARFRVLTALTAFTAVLALALSYRGMVHYGQIGALLGMLVGEAVNLVGIVWLLLLERHRAAPPPEWIGVAPSRS
ncbi:MAG TPA: hypothetical protein VM074_02540 [Solimonas sp.]|nr:hypothetical protein [Solimonas sp.]